MEKSLKKCVVCGFDFTGSHNTRKYCSTKCKARWRKMSGFKQGKHHVPVELHKCRSCGNDFKINKSQGNKWLCSLECIRNRNSELVRKYASRGVEKQAEYRAKTKSKMLPDSQLIRFYRINPDAPKQCESCGEKRVLEIAHKPGHERNGERRSSKNMKWPEKVWVLCPTCHRLIDRMGYSIKELGLNK